MIRLIIIWILLNTNLLFARDPKEHSDTRPLKSINLNLLGDASLISMNYERLLPVNTAFIASSKLGLGYNEEFKYCFWNSTCSPPNRYLTIPHHITGNFGKGRHFFELGLGGTVIIGNTTQHYFFYPIIGYRILPVHSDQVGFRIFGEIPFSGIQTKDILFIPFGLNFGVYF